MNNKIELHTIATFQGKEYELEKLLNNLLNMLEEKDKEIQRLTKGYKEFEKWIKEDKEYAMNNFECGRCFNMFDILNKLKELKGSDK